jgi:hypothetical protein
LQSDVVAALGTCKNKLVGFIHSFRIALHPVATGCTLTRCSNAWLASQREAQALFADQGRQLAGPQLTVTGKRHKATPEEAVMIARVYGDGNLIPKSEIGKELIPAIGRLLRE